MSSEAVKKRGRPKKAVVLEEEVIMIEKSPKSKPRKATLKKQTVRETVEPTKPLPEPTETAEHTPVSKSQTKKGANGRNSAKSTLASSDTAKPKLPSSAGSTILQQATAFTNVTEQTTLTNPRVRQINGANPIPTEGPIKAGEIALSDTRTKVTEPRQEQTTSLAFKEEETQLGAEQMSSDEAIEKTASPGPPERSGTLVSEEDPARLIQESQQKAADAMVMFPLPSGKHDKIGAEISNTTDTSSSPKSEPSPAAKPITASKTNPRLPTSFPPPATPPPPPRPTQLPYHELKKNPEFKALSRKYTSLLIAIPIALFTSYVLYGRYTNQTVRRRIGDQGPIERNGGAKPRLLVENTATTPNDATGTAAVNPDKRLLEE